MITVKRRASAASAGSHCDGARKNGNSTSAGPWPCACQVMPACDPPSAAWHTRAAASRRQLANTPGCLGPVSDHVGPAWRIIAIEHDAAGVRQPWHGPCGDLGAHAVLRAVTSTIRSDSARMAPDRAGTACTTPGCRCAPVRPRPARHVAGHLRRDMRRGQPQMVPQRHQPFGQRHAALRHRASPLLPPRLRRRLHPALE